MKRRFLVLLWVLGLAKAAFGQTVDDPNEGARLTHDSGNNYSFDWWGRSGRSYFLQHSEDLLLWVYFPDVIESGLGAPLSYGFGVTGPSRYFLRLKYSDIPTGNAATADFDGDGVSNYDELQLGTDPFGGFVDTDGDGISNDLEQQYGLDPNAAPVADPTGQYVSLEVLTPLEPAN